MDEYDYPTQEMKDYATRQNKKLLDDIRRLVEEKNFYQRQAAIAETRIRSLEKHNTFLQETIRRKWSESSEEVDELVKDGKRYRKLLKLAEVTDVENEDEWWTDYMSADYRWLSREWIDGVRVDRALTISDALDRENV